MVRGGVAVVDVVMLSGRMLVRWVVRDAAAADGAALLLLLSLPLMLLPLPLS